jgi:hypothetical protein
MQLEIGAISNGTCSECAGLVDTYILDYEGVDDYGWCTWRYTFPTPLSLCSGKYEIDWIKFALSNAEGYINVLAAIGYTGSFGDSYLWMWTKLLPALPLDCTALSDYSLGFGTQTYISVSECAGSSATCLVTAVAP